MRKLAHPKKIAFVALGALAFMLAISAPSHAAGVGGHGFGGGHGGGAMGQHGSEGHHFEGHGFEGHGFEGHHFEGHDFDGHHFEGRHFDRDDRFGFRFGPVFPYYAPYFADPGYLYYCPDYQAYYPSVTSCPESWVQVPVQ